MVRTRTPARAAETMLIGILLLEGVLALAGGVMLIAAPSGRLLQMPAAWLEGTPFGSYLAPGLVLASALGLLPLFAAFALWRVHSVTGLRQLERALGMDTAWLASFAAGTGIMIWIVTQVAMIRKFHPMQPLVFALGAAIVALSLLPAVRGAHRPPRVAPQRKRNPA